MQELAKRIFPLCESFLLINQFVESRSQFKTGLVNHAFAAALRAFLLVGLLHCKSFDFLMLCMVQNVLFPLTRSWNDCYSQQIFV